MAGAAGVLLRIRGETRFLPATQVEAILPTPRLSEVPGSAFRLALIAGRVVPVLELGPPSGHVVVCSAGGEAVALAGVSVEEAGFVMADADGVTPFDIARELANAGMISGSPSGEGERK